MKNNIIQLSQLSDCVNTKLFFHIFSHFKCNNLSIETIHNRWYIQLAVHTRYFRDVSKKFLHGLFSIKISFDEIFFFLNFCCCFCKTTRLFIFMDISSCRHSTIYGTLAQLYTLLNQRRVHSVVSVIAVIRMFVKDFFYSDQKKLLSCRFAAVFQPTIVTGFANFQHLAHYIYSIVWTTLKNEHMTFWSLYFFRSFAKKPRASFNISFACWSSASSFSSWRIFFKVSGLEAVASSFFRHFRSLRQSAIVL